MLFFRNQLSNATWSFTIPNTCLSIGRPLQFLSLSITLLLQIDRLVFIRCHHHSNTLSTKSHKVPFNQLLLLLLSINLHSGIYTLHITSFFSPRPHRIHILISVISSASSNMSLRTIVANPRFPFSSFFRLCSKTTHPGTFHILLPRVLFVSCSVNTVTSTLSM